MTLGTHTVSREIAGKTFTFSTGKYAKQANGAVFAQIGDTHVLSTAVMAKKVGDQDFFPLSVHYNEKYYAAGRVPGNYFKRETKPTDREVLTCRLIDRPLRPLFPKGFRTEVQIVPTAMNMDGVNPPDVVGMNAASACLVVSDIPFHGPVGAVRVVQKDGEFIINPSYEESKDANLELAVAGTVKAITMIEGDAAEANEETVLEAIERAHEAIKEIVDLQNELQAKCGKAKIEVTLFQYHEDLEKELNDSYFERAKTALNNADKTQREADLSAVFEEAIEAMKAKYDEAYHGQIGGILHDMEAKVVRDDILFNKKRQDGRGLDELRHIECEVNLLPNVHGSAVFTRGQTQALAVTTLGTARDSMNIEQVLDTKNKNFYLQYNFPPFSVGETGRMGAPGRREVGHGMLAERSLASMVPANDEFVYSARVVSEVLESNGSSSMATVCAGSMSMMAAGVPLRNAVAGIAMGLILEGDTYQILTDIQGLEDHLGDMDFKVAGTERGITGFQLDIKIEGITPEIMKKALAQAKIARLDILSKMNQAISEPSKEVNQNVPQVDSVTVPVDKIRNVIGSGGKNIKAIVEETGSDIDINDDGKVSIFAKDAEKMELTKKLIEQYVGIPKIGTIYEGKVKKIMPFGCFVEIFPGTDGLVHISELANHRVGQVEDVVREGQDLRVKVIKIDDSGRVNLSHKDTLAEENSAESE